MYAHGQRGAAYPVLSAWALLRRYLLLLRTHQDNKTMEGMMHLCEEHEVWASPATLLCKVSPFVLL